VATIITGIFVGVAALFSSLDAMVDLTNIGTLFAFLLVCIASSSCASRILIANVRSAFPAARGSSPFSADSPASSCEVPSEGVVVPLRNLVARGDGRLPLLRLPPTAG